MGWFGGGGSSDSKSRKVEENFTSSDAEGFSGASTNFASSSPAGGNAGSSVAAELQQFSLGLQQQMLIQAVVTNLNDISFNRCITGKPGESLSGKEVACIHATVGKWLDSNEFIMGRMQRKQQAAQSPGGL